MTWPEPEARELAAHQKPLWHEVQKNARFMTPGDKCLNQRSGCGEQPLRKELRMAVVGQQIGVGRPSTLRS